MRAQPASSEAQYNARLAIPDHPEIFARWTSTSAVVRGEFECFEAAYGAAHAERIDVFPASEPNGRVLVFIHGGYWRSRDKSEFSFIVPELHRRGITVAIPEYTLAPKASVREIVEQMRRACAWVGKQAAQWGANPEEIYLSGHSAGGHLVAMMLADDPHASDEEMPVIAGGLAISGLFDLRPLVGLAFLQDDLKLAADEAARVSPALMQPRVDVPLATAVGALESDAFKWQSELIRERWPELAATHVEAAARNHLTVVDDLTNATSALFKQTLSLMQMD